MPMKKVLIPRQNEDFYFWQANFVNRVVTNQVAWGLPAANLAEAQQVFEREKRLIYPGTTRAG